MVQENVTGARVVKAYVREDTEEKRFDDANISLMESNLRVQTLMAILQPLLMIILNLSVIAVIVIGGWQVQAQAMKVGEVMAGYHISYSGLAWRKDDVYDVPDPCKGFRICKQIERSPRN